VLRFWGDDGRKRVKRRMTFGPIAKEYITISIPYPSSFLEPNKKNMDNPIPTTKQKTRIVPTKKN
jgi:hypothetical protein